MKRVFMPILFLIPMLAILSGCGSDSPEYKQIRLNKTVHSVFYTPHYVAMEKGFFEEEGLQLTIDVAQGSDRSMTALISGNADISLLGPETGIYVYNQGREDFPVIFAQLTRRPGNFLISRTNDEDFSWQDVRGKTIIGGRNHGMPQMVLEYILRNHGITPHEDVTIITNLDFTTTAGAFAAGEGDFTVEFEPAATELENNNRGFVVAPLGPEAQVPYTVFMTTPQYLEENPETIQKFTNAVYRGMQWVMNNTAREAAYVIHPQFPELSIEDLTTIIERYKSVETWNTDPILTEEDFNLLLYILQDGDPEIDYVPFTELVNNDFAYTAIQNVNY
jgi:NitT/TauT family transport system substrate-binding protein